MIRVKQCCCGCTLDVGVRIIIWTDLIATFMVGLSIMANSINGEYCSDVIWGLSAVIIPLKLVILIGAVMGLNKKEASYLKPYVIYNVLAVLTMGLLVIVAIFKFDQILESDLMKYLMGTWEIQKKEFERGYRIGKYNHNRSMDADGLPAQDESNPLDRPDVEHAVRAACLVLAIISGIINFFVWTYLNIVLYSHYKNLKECGNFTNIDGVEYFAPTEHSGGKHVPPGPQGAPTQYSQPPSYFATPPYPIQPAMPYSPAPPSYDEAAGPNAFATPSLPATKQ